MFGFPSVSWIWLLFGYSSGSDSVVVNLNLQLLALGLEARTAAGVYSMFLKQEMNNHFGLCFTDALIHFIFHCGKIEWQFSELLSCSLPRITLSRPCFHQLCCCMKKPIKWHFSAGHKNKFFSIIWYIKFSAPLAFPTSQII